MKLAYSRDVACVVNFMTFCSNNDCFIKDYWTFTLSCIHCNSITHAFRTGEPLAPPRPPKPSHTEDLYQNIGNNSPLLLRNSPHPTDNFNVTSPSTNNRIINHRHQNSAPERFIFPSTINTLPLNQPIPTSRGNSAANSPAPTRRTTDSPTLRSPPMNGRASPARNISVDTIYYNTGVVTSPHSTSSNAEVVISPPPNSAGSVQSPLLLTYSNSDNNTGVATSTTFPHSNGASSVDSQPIYSNSQSASRSEIESMYDVPKSLLNISQPIAAPVITETNTTVHKYVNAAAGIITRPLPARDNQNNEIMTSGSTASLIEGQYDLGPGRPSEEDNKPHRPPKPRNLSDTNTLDGE